MTEAYIGFVEKYLPSPFVIALLLTLITFIFALFFTGKEASIVNNGIDILGFWQQGLWELLAFTMQMVLILLLGHTLALTAAFSKFINLLADSAKNTAQAAAMVSFFAILLSFFNWGLCVIFGAILSRKLAERFSQKGRIINYGLIGAAGYSGMMTWHGGFSGSAPLKVAEANHFLVDKIGSISIDETIFSTMNVAVSVVIIIAIPLVLLLIGQKLPGKNIKLQASSETSSEEKSTDKEAEDKVWIAKLLGIIMLVSAILYGFRQYHQGANIIDLNFINLLLFALSISLHKNLRAFLHAVDDAIKGVSGIIIQFPLYAGIMGIMKYSGLVVVISDTFVSISTVQTFPIFTFISAAVVNFFVPSGGGQWAVQGPIIAEAATNLNIAIPKVVMALSYGDQLSNMLQPFWALPLLGLTGLKAKDIIPYTSVLFILGLVVYGSVLIIF
ncbi:short-chain fatty acid transporter [Marivirga atlantica]|uniref:Short-chain fatty acid transporter n=1 Tax=Marivirga atlantica TaxID=1548457 RepID=A0A937AAW4_9BACT|nr:short-chain fatty acid transporter [Marivirga atlantica]